MAYFTSHSKIFLAFEGLSAQITLLRRYRRHPPADNDFQKPQPAEAPSSSHEASQGLEGGGENRLKPVLLFFVEQTGTASALFL
ncbi:hypothetical protein [Zavarzinella formosa]|uniref:hypothetical protein n=1 Tax=Zavarzinella formosa TaxID=360055 RepID=UPI00036F2C39|nr:hypothetical protein [Zavarzinella formosa]